MVLYRLSLLRHKYSKGSFLLATQIPNINNIKPGLCPHGLPPGACPICSNIGGSSSMRMGERAQKAGEMSYHQCAMIGNMMRARELAEKQHSQNLAKHSELQKDFINTLEQILNKLQDYIKQNSNLLNIKPNSITAKILIFPFFNAIKVITNSLITLANKLTLIKEKFIDIIDKLNAIFGEAKAFINKKISKMIDLLKTKFITLIKIFSKNNTDDEDTKIYDDKKIYTLKKILHKIIRKKNKDGNDNKNK